MKLYSYFIILPCILFMISACSLKKSPPPKPVWPYAKDGITIRFKASPLLNLSEGSPHSLMVCLYQLRNKSMFEQLASNEDGINQLLDCEAYNDSVNKVERIFIHPKQNLSIVENRTAGTRYLGVVAGYFVRQKERMIRTIDIPVVETATSSFPVVRSKKTAEAGILNLVINMGSEQIAAIQSY